MGDVIDLVQSPSNDFHAKQFCLSGARVVSETSNAFWKRDKPYNYLGISWSVKIPDKSPDDFPAKLIVLFMSPRFDLNKQL